MEIQVYGQVAKGGNVRTRYVLVLSSFLLLASWPRSSVGQSQVLDSQMAFTIVGYDERGGLSFHGTIVVFNPNSQAPSCAMNLVDQDKRGRVLPSSHSGLHVVKIARWISVRNETIRLSFKLHDFLADGIYTIEFGIDDDKDGTWKFETAHGVPDHGDCSVKQIDSSGLEGHGSVTELVAFWEDKAGL